MRWLRPIFTLLMAAIIGGTSMGLSVSSHACSESGIAEAGIGHLKACCKLADGKGFQSEPCCKVSVRHIKLPTVRTQVSAPTAPAAPAACILPASDLLAAALPHPRLDAATPAHPPEGPPPLTAPARQALLCTFTI